MPNGNQKKGRKEEKEKIASLQGFRLTLFLHGTASANHVRRGLLLFVPNAPHSRFSVLDAIHWHDPKTGRSRLVAVSEISERSA